MEKMLGLRLAKRSHAQVNIGECPGFTIKSSFLSEQMAASVAAVDLPQVPVRRARFCRPIHQEKPDLTLLVLRLLLSKADKCNSQSL